jgi:cell division protein FtsB
MVQDQLVEYVSTQLKLGVSRDTIKSALTGVGWAPLDVEDTIKKVEGGAPAAPAQTPPIQKAPDTVANPTASPKFVSFSTPGTVAAAKSPEPQTIRVSDLVSSSPSSATSSSVSVTAPKIMSGVADASKTQPKSSFLNGPSPSFVAQPSVKKKAIGLVGILAIVLIVVLAVLAGYLFINNNSLQGQLSSAQGGQQTQGAAQSSAAAAQIQALNASNTVLAAQISSFTVTNQDLMTNLSFFVVPANASSSATSSPVAVGGILSAGLGKNTYIITTAYGVKVSVKNSSTAAVAAALQPLLGTTVQVSGTYLPGTPNINVVTVNGAPVVPPIATTTTPAAPLAPTSTTP